MINKKDIGVIVVVAILSGLVGLIISSVVFGGSKAYDLKAPQIQPISGEFINPDSKYFNEASINPTVDIQIGDTNNPDAL